MRRRDRPLAGGEHVETDEIIEAWTAPFTLAPGHPLRGARCLQCATLIGPAVVRVFTVLDLRHKGCRCGAVASMSFPVCAGHGQGRIGDLAHVAQDRWLGHHGGTP